MVFVIDNLGERFFCVGIYRFESSQYNICFV